MSHLVVLLAACAAGLGVWAALALSSERNHHEVMLRLLGNDARSTSRETWPASVRPPSAGLLERLTAGAWRRLPRPLREAAASRLASAGLEAAHAEEMLKQGVGWAVAIAAISLSPLVAGEPPQTWSCLAGVALGAYLPWFRLSWLAEARLAAALDELPTLLDLLTIALESGVAVQPALEVAAVQCPGPLGAELGKVLRELSAGVPLSAALERLGEALPLPELRAFLRALQLSLALGSPLADVCRSQARAVRHRNRQLLEERLGTLPLRLTAVTVAFFFPVLFILTILPNVLQLRSWQ